MHKKILSVLLAAALTASVASVAHTAQAAEVKTESAVSSNTVESADDFSWDNANVYFLMTDRFYNGNTSNDHSYGRTIGTNGSAVSGWNTAPGTFHGGDFAGITQKINAGYFDDLGTTALWISAPYEQIHGYVSSGNGDFAHYSYHGYYVLDYTEFDKNFGTAQEFKTMVDTAHSHGLRVILDIVMNHAGYNTFEDMHSYNFGKITDWDALSQWRNKLTSVTNPNFNDYIDYTSSDWSTWWGTWVRSGLPGYTEPGGDARTMSLAGLPDFKTESSSNVTIPQFLQTKWNAEGTLSAKNDKYGTSNTVTGFISSWLAEYVKQYGVDGFRCDTAKHVEYASWNQLKTKCVAALKQWRQNNPTAPGADWDEDFWMTGEHWDWNVGWGKDEYFTQGGFDSMINFDSSGSNLPGVSNINGKYADYANKINNVDGFNALTYISSHDSNLARGQMAYQGTALQLLPGAIQVFYGDETNRPVVSGLAFDGQGGSGHSLRSDMNWNSIDQTVLTHWQKVGKFRKNHVAVGAGSHNLISAYNAATGLTFARSYDDGETADDVIVCMGAPANTNIDVNVSSVWGNNTTVTNAYDGTTAVVSGGKATFNSGSQGVILIEGPQSSISMNLKGDYSFYDSETVTVSLRGADYAMASINGGTPFRVTAGQTFQIGEGIEVGTVFEVEMTAQNSQDTLTKSFQFKKKDPNAVTRVYFDNSSYNWSKVNCYIYDESGSTVIENGAWPGPAMTLDSSTGYYVIEVPDNLVGGGYAIFSENGGSRRYPGEMQQGLAIGGENKIFLANHVWQVYDGSIVIPSSSSDVVTGKVLLGDVNLDKKITVTDATLIQKHLAEISALTGDALVAADVDQSRIVTIKDATAVQFYVVGNTGHSGQCGQTIGSDPTTTKGNDGSTVTLNASATSTGTEDWYAWTWPTGGNGRWVKGTGTASAVTFTDLDANVLFVRSDPSMTVDWQNGSVWNKTEDLVTQQGGTYTTSGWNNNIMNGSWG